ncbi:Fc.00g105980.m01.CDS01 [Cosmosporella sp. VM-42]
MSTPVPEPQRSFEEIKKCIARCERELQVIRSPSDVYEERVAAVNTSIRNVSQSLSGPSHSVNPKALGDIVAFGGRLKELEIKYKATLRQEEDSYQQKLEAAVQRLCDALVATMGRPVVERSLRKLSSRESNQVNPTEPTNAPVDRQVIEVRTESICGKRTHDGTQASENRPKRRRLDGDQKSRKSKRAIRFDEVFQNGNAPIKHVIVQFPAGHGAWYILRCEEHNLNFKESPLIGARTHLGGRTHGRVLRDPAIVIKHLGIEVLGCNEALAEKNNSVAVKAFRNGYEHPPGTKKAAEAEAQDSQKHGSEDHMPATRSRRHKDSAGIGDPIPGEIYLAYRKKSKVFMAVLLLPKDDLDLVGVPSSLELLGLMQNVPECYTYNRRSKKLKWREGYEDGGSLVSKREFPVMYFDGQDFPSKSEVGWTAAEDLSMFDLQSSKSSPGVHHHSVEKFLRERGDLQSDEEQDIKEEAVEVRGSPTPSPGPAPACISPRSSYADDQEASVVDPCPDAVVIDSSPSSSHDIQQIHHKSEALPKVIAEIPHSPLPESRQSHHNSELNPETVAERCASPSQDTRQPHHGSELHPDSVIERRDPPWRDMQQLHYSSEPHQEVTSEIPFFPPQTMQQPHHSPEPRRGSSRSFGSHGPTSMGNTQCADTIASDLVEPNPIDGIPSEVAFYRTSLDGHVQVIRPAPEVNHSVRTEIANRAQVILDSMNQHAPATQSKPPETSSRFQAPPEPCNMQNPGFFQAGPSSNPAESTCPQPTQMPSRSTGTTQPQEVEVLVTRRDHLINEQPAIQNQQLMPSAFQYTTQVVTSPSTQSSSGPSSSIMNNIYSQHFSHDSSPSVSYHVNPIQPPSWTSHQTQFGTSPTINPTSSSTSPVTYRLPPIIPPQDQNTPSQPIPTSQCAPAVSAPAGPTPFAGVRSPQSNLPPNGAIPGDSSKSLPDAASIATSYSGYLANSGAGIEYAGGHFEASAAPAPQTTSQIPNNPSVNPELNAWPYRVPEHLAKTLDEYRKFANLAPGIAGFKTPDGAYCCPICRKKYIRTAFFTDHLAKHGEFKR